MITSSDPFWFGFRFVWTRVVGTRVLLAWVALGVMPVAAKANEPGQETPEVIAEFIEFNCVGCHDSYTKEGDLDLEALTLSLDDPDNFHRWERVFDRVRAGEMPPDEQIEDGEKQGFLAKMHDTLLAADSNRIAKGGRVAARRLTRNQYERNVNELLQVNLPLRQLLPEESMSFGFDTVSKSQQVSDHSIAAYLDAADWALQTAFDRLLSGDRGETVRLDWTKLRRNERRHNREPEGRPDHQDIVSWSCSQNFYGRMPATSVTQSANYRIRIKAHAINLPKMGRVWCSVESGVCSGNASTMYWVGAIEATDEPRVYEFDAWIRDSHMLRIVPNDKGIGRVAAQKVDQKAGTLENEGVPGVAIQWIEMQRLVSDQEQLRHTLVGELRLEPLEEPTSNRAYRLVSKAPRRDLKQLLHRFAERAFRRLVSVEEMQPYLDFASAKWNEKRSLRDALQTGYRAILCSSRFLYFEEAPGELDDFAVANRLSHMVWGKAPDEQLRNLAAAGELRNPDTLREQTERLLNDPQSATFIEEFATQWLELYELDSTTPDGQLYPEYDDTLHRSLTQETFAFLSHLIENDLPITNVVDSDFTFVNQRLARHYSLEWPGGTGFQKVAVDRQSRRGGMITHASVLKVTANGTTTSPIIRGVWMLEKVMGEHVPPPPANVPAVEPDIRGATSIRDQLDKHRSIDSCAACHVKIDPPGFALESYDVIGGWRDRYRAAGKKKRWVPGLPVDPSHEFTTGEAFDNMDGLKDILLKRDDQLAANMASHLVTYSTGAAPTFADRAAIDHIVQQTDSFDHGMRSMIHAVVQSPLFLSK